MRSATFSDLLARALVCDDEVRGRLEQASRSAKNPCSRLFFEALMEEELSHRRRLEMLRTSLATVADVELSDAALVEAGALCLALGESDIDDLQAPDDVLLAAAKRQQHARAVFARLAQEATHPELGQAFRELARAEGEHQRAVRACFQACRRESRSRRPLV
jgi:rubrerythrin